MATKVSVKSTLNTGTDTYLVEGEPQGLSSLVNEAIKLSNKFVTFTREDGQKVSVIAQQVVELSEE